MIKSIFQKKIIFLCFIGTFSLLLIAYKSVDFYKVNQFELNDKDKKSLEYFFRSAFDDGFAYVLFGHKPLAFCGFNKIQICENNKIQPLYLIAKSVYEAYKPNNKKIKQGWETWKKYRHLLNSDNFIIKSEPNPSNDGFECIIIINKSSFLETLDSFKEDFSKVLGKTFDAQKTLKQCERGENLFKDLLKGHSALIGILLGYGKENSWNYYEREQLEKMTNQLDYDTKKIRQQIFDLNNKLMIFSPEDCELLDNFFNSIPVNEDSIEKYLANLPILLTLPQFKANPNSIETQKLKEIYSQDRKEIIKLYENKEFLKTTLSKLQERKNTSHENLDVKKNLFTKAK